jgi:hypothetical protein
VVVERVRAEDNAFGFEALNAGGLAVRHSAFEANATGVVLGTWPQEQNPPQRGVHLWRNVIASNNGTDTPRRGLTETVDAPDGVGVWVAGGWFDNVEDNTVSGHARYGIAVSWLAAPAFTGRILRNTVSGSETADLAWDGIGADVCFSGNSFETSVPQGAEDLYPCGPLPTVGVPQPQVTADLLGP